MFKYLNKGISTVLVVSLLVVIALGFGGFFTYRYWWTQREGEVATPEAETVEPEGKAGEKTASEDETADWQVYRNENYGFTISYPEDWKIVREEIETVSLGDAFSDEIKGKFNLDLTGKGESRDDYSLHGDVRLFYYLPLEGVNLMEGKIFSGQLIVLKSHGTYGVYEETEMHGVDGYRGVEYIKGFGEEEREDMSMGEIFPDKEGKGIFLIRGSSIDLSNKIYQEQVKEVIASFEFLE